MSHNALRFCYSKLTASQRERIRALLPSDEARHNELERYGLGQSRVKALHDATLSYFQQRSFEGVALTLTFKPCRHPTLLTTELAQATVAEFLKRINKFSAGRRTDAPPLRVIAVREGSPRSGAGAKRLHYHLLLEKPATLTGENFGSKCRHYWSRLDWASSHQNDVQLDADAGWLSYILKMRSKLDYAESIDWINTNV